jgi:hypothetical protein
MVAKGRPPSLGPTPIGWHLPVPRRQRNELRDNSKLSPQY